MTFGTIFDLKRFALHDGSGLRSTLFLKGCPLTCPWCQNPEGVSSRIHLRWIASKCIRCGLCVDSCNDGTLSRAENGDIHIHHSGSGDLKKYVDICPTGALCFDGRRVSADEIAEELLSDRVFFESSGGGITLSGGEPLAQPAFSAEVLRLCREAGISTALETTLGVPLNAVKTVLPYTDRFLADMKIADPEDHQRILNADVTTVRANLDFLLKHGANVLIRIALIPDFTAREENVRGLGAYISTLHPQPPVELLNFNPLAENKYRLLGRHWPIPKETPRFSPKELNHFADVLLSAGVKRIEL